ncbi:MAG: HgcAB-like fusion protein [Fidelibacterota bacterium]
MGGLTYMMANVVETCLRVLPIPTKTGLTAIGNPGRDAPVLLTGNFHLTVQRVKRAVRELDLYLLVANSRGVNVWCAATGGLFTNHDVISVLKTSGIEELVDHRRFILPQLAATGIERKTVREKTGWRGIWGPVEARDIPGFLERNGTKTPDMREVDFPLVRRFEMAVAWAFPISAVLGLLLLLFWRTAIVPVTLLTWGLSFLIFLSFPLYSKWLNPKAGRIGLVLFDFGRGGIHLILLAAVLAGLILTGVVTDSLSWGFVLRWGIISSVVIILVSIDLMGSTPVYKSGLHKDRLLEVVLDEGKCKGAGFCEQVCPRNCYEVDRERHVATRPRADLCVQCGACIVQCPFDALFFEAPGGEMIPPETIRKFKLNMMGKRAVTAGGK